MVVRAVSAVALLLGIFPLQILGDVPRGSGEDGEAEFSPFLPSPTEAEVLAALPNVSPRRGVRISFHVSAPRIGPMRIYPQVGRARLIVYLFKCSVQSSQGREEVYIEKGELRLAR